MKLVNLLSVLVGVSLSAAAQPLDLLKKSNRVVFLGDSITSQGTYTANFATWATTRLPGQEIEWINVGLASETVSGLSENGHAGGRFPRPDLHERLTRVLNNTKPDLVLACYGMNCGIYQPMDDERFSKYKKGIEWLNKECTDAGAKVIFLTPPYYDAHRKTQTSFYTDVLAKYSDWLLSRRKDGWHVIDVNGTMTDFVTSARKGNPRFTLQPDGVHPNKQGHWIMAQAMINWFGDEDAATADSVHTMLKAKGLPTEIADLTEKRMKLLHAAWLTKTKHTRPGVRAGKPLPEARKLADDLDRQIAALLDA